MKLETASHENAKAEGLAKIATDGHVLTYLPELKVDVFLLLPCLKLTVIYLFNFILLCLHVQNYTSHANVQVIS